MARLATTIVGLLIIAALLVDIRREEVAVRYEIHRCVSRQTALRRDLWSQRFRIGRLLAPAELRKMTNEMALDLTAEDEPCPRLAEGGSRPAQPADQ